jgi:hypothetical protein
MAEKANGDYYYDAGTINEQLDEYEIYELDGKLYLNNEAGGSDEYVSFDGVSQLLGGWRDTDLSSDELEEGEGGLYVHESGGGTYSLRFAFYVPGGSVVVNELDADLGTA